MVVIPAGIVIHHGTGGRVHRQIIDPTVADDPDFAPVTQAVAIVSTRTNGSSPLSSTASHDLILFVHPQIHRARDHPKHPSG